MKKLLVLLTLAAVFQAEAPKAFGVESVSECFVGMAISVQGNRGSQAGTTCFNVPVVQPVCSAGSVTGVGSRTLTDSGAIWSDNQYNGINGAFYVEFDSGVRINIVGTQAANESLLLAEDPPANLGVPYRIRRHLSVQDIFGARDEAGLVPGRNAAEADRIGFYSAASQTASTIFYSSVPNYNGWYFDNYQPAGSALINPEQGLMLFRTSSAFVLYLHGVAKQQDTRAPVFTGLNFLGSLKTTAPTRLGDLALYTGDPLAGIVAASNPTAGDNVAIMHADGTVSTFFYSSVPGYPGWFDSGYHPADDTLFAPGEAFFVIRKSPRAKFYWNTPWQ